MLLLTLYSSMTRRKKIPLPPFPSLYLLTSLTSLPLPFPSLPSLSLPCYPVHAAGTETSNPIPFSEKMLIPLILPSPGGSRGSAGGGGSRGSGGGDGGGGGGSGRGGDGGPYYSSFLPSFVLFHSSLSPSFTLPSFLIPFLPSLSSFPFIPFLSKMFKLLYISPEKCIN